MTLLLEAELQRYFLNRQKFMSKIYLKKEYLKRLLEMKVCISVSLLVLDVLDSVKLAPMLHIAHVELPLLLLYNIK